MSSQINKNGLNTLIEHRDAILLAEIGALIHDLGKLSEEFISNKSEDNPLKEKDKHAQWIFDWYPRVAKLLENLNIYVRDIPVLTKSGKKITSAELSVKDLIENHHNNKKTIFDEKQMVDKDNAKKYLITLFQRSADGLDSGIDKGAVSNLHKQTFNQTYISTSFGYEFKRIEVENNELKKKREEFIKILEEVLTELSNLLSSSSKISENDWIRLREKLYYKARDCFSYGLGETRRSANDVTLWDHSHSAASLYKSALAEIIISNKWKNPKDIRWRLLLIRFNGLDYILKGIKIADIEGRRTALNNALDKVRNLLEVIIPVGNEIYRDENGSVFLVSESLNKQFLKAEYKVSLNFKDKNNWIVSGKGEDISLEKVIQRIFEFETKKELKPSIEISDKKSRGATILGYCLERYKVLYNTPSEEKIKDMWKTAEKKVVCSVCGLKPADPKEKICKDCKGLRSSRAKKWYKERRNNTDSTIWLDEIRDKNNRVGIIVGAFDLKYWLNGMWFNTCFTKTLRCLKEQNPEIFHFIDPQNSWEDLVSAVEEALKLNNPDAILTGIKKRDGSNIKVRELLQALGGKDSYKGQAADEYFEAIVINRESGILKDLYGIDINKASLREKAELLVLFLLRKNPSFARIRRAWETCAKFWEKVKGIVLEELKERTRYRIILTQDSEKELENLTNRDKIFKNRAYEIRAKGLRIPIFIGEDDIIVVDYIESEEAKNKIENALKEGFELYEPSDYGYYSRKIYPFEDNQRLLRCEQLVKDSNYKPHFTILEGYPSINAFIVPLDSVWNIIKRIKKLYEIEFSKVQNRLPLKLGLFAMKRKYPLYSALDCVKRFFLEDIGIYRWHVEKNYRVCSEEICKIFDGKLGNYVQKVVLSDGLRRAIVYVSYSLGEPSEEDLFYPYFILDDTDVLLYTDFCKNVLGISENRISVKHVKKLSQNDKVIFLPSIFDFELLDSNIRRFDIGKKRRHWLFTDSINAPKPYLLWDVDCFERLRNLVQRLGLTTTQVMNLYEMLIAKLEEWNIRKPPLELMYSDNEEDKKKAKVFEKFVENAIKSVPLRLDIIKDESRRGKISKEDFEFLKDTIMSGLFFDFVDLWHTILKKKFEEGDEDV